MLYVSIPVSVICINTNSMDLADGFYCSRKYTSYILSRVYALIYTQFIMHVFGNTFYVFISLLGLNCLTVTV